MLLMIDNNDSFTWNLVHYLGELGATVKVVPAAKASRELIRSLQPEAIVISPGPGTPGQAVTSQAAIREFGATVPILGVCLGHQCIAEVFGARVGHAGAVMHGRASWVQHTGEGVFTALAQPLKVIRYHSLAVLPETLPECLQVTATARDDTSGAEVIMGLRHRTLAIEGVQFHPESIESQGGHALLANFLQIVRSRSA